jgi:predicted ATPase
VLEVKLPLLGFSISSFKSFYGPQQFVGPLKQINVIIGENNSGKSNIVRYLKKVVSVASQGNYNVLPEDRPQLQSAQDLKFNYNLLDFEHISRNIFSNSSKDHTPVIPILEWYLEQFAEKSEGESFWLPSNLAVGGKLEEFKNESGLLELVLSDQIRVKTLWNTVCNMHGGSYAQNWLPETLLALSRLSVPQFGIEYIPAARKVETSLPQYVDELGPPSLQAKQFIQDLSKFSSPTANNYGTSQARWSSVTNFVRQLMRDQTIELEIPYSQDTILIKQYGRVLNLEDTGTGIHQAVLLAARATTTHHPVVIIEEPETHFHPELQRQLMQYFSTQTDKQFFITTHSAHIMDAVDAAVVSVRIEDGYSVIDMPLNRAERHLICHRLGYRPSDLMQANALIWIEGPSDRIYLNHWIKAVAPNLEEGWHYSFSIYGGRLLSRFSAVGSDEADDLIALLPINRFPFVIMDSDRKTKEDDINDTKRRIQTELDQDVWITAGREIENYIPWKLRNQAVIEIHKAQSLQKDQTAEFPFDHPLAYLKDGKDVSSSFDKPKIAEHICEREADLSVLDLNEKIKGLVQFIKNANRMN